TLSICKISFLQNLSQVCLYVFLNISFVLCFVIYAILLIEGVKLARYVASKLKLNPVKPNDNKKAKPEIQKEETKTDDENKDFNDIYKM
ncbi:MAG: hypothetical protein K5765_08970, partial [Clostridia bacterium]|nr:hypothetical protein [Clostridia bacterium]